MKQRIKLILWRAIPFVPICYGVVGFFLLIMYAFGYGWENSDTPSYVGVFQIFLQFLAVLLKLGTIFAMLFLLAEFARYFADPKNGWRRWWQSVVTMITTTSATALLTFLNHDFVQKGTNGPPYKRISPDDFREIIYIGPIANHDGSDFYPNFLNPNILITELLAVVFTVIASFGTIWLLRHQPRWATVITPLVIFACLWIYGDVFAPWAFIVDYDFFVGDMVLGAMTGEFMFVVFPFDNIATILFGVNTAASLLLIRYWYKG